MKPFDKPSKLSYAEHKVPPLLILYFQSLRVYISLGRLKKVKLFKCAIKFYKNVSNDTLKFNATLILKCLLLNINEEKDRLNFYCQNVTFSSYTYSKVNKHFILKWHFFADVFHLRRFFSTIKLFLSWLIHRFFFKFCLGECLNDEWITIMVDQLFFFENILFFVELT